MNGKNLYCAIIRNAEALHGKEVSHDTAKKGEFSVTFLKLPRCPSWRHCPAVSSKRSVQWQRKPG